MKFLDEHFDSMQDGWGTIENHLFQLVTAYNIKDVDYVHVTKHMGWFRLKLHICW